MAQTAAALLETPTYGPIGMKPPTCIHAEPCINPQAYGPSLLPLFPVPISLVQAKLPGPCSKSTKLLKLWITSSHVVNSSHGPVRPNHLEPCTHTRRKSWKLDSCMNNMLLVFHAMLCQAVGTAPMSATAVATPRQLALATDKQPTASSLKMSPIAACVL